MSLDADFLETIAELEAQLADLQARYDADKERGHKYRSRLEAQLASVRAERDATEKRVKEWAEWAGRLSSQLSDARTEVERLRQHLVERDKVLAGLTIALEASADERFREQWKADVGNPFFEAARAAADERISALKHEARSNLMRAQAAERQLAEARALFKKGQG
jgi:chromosome segregation ATPase